MKHKLLLLMAAMLTWLTAIATEVLPSVKFITPSIVRLQW